MVYFKIKCLKYFKVLFFLIFLIFKYILKNMPQFDSAIILPEIFWLFLSFIFLYFNVSLFNKAYLLRSNFFRKNWLFSFLKSSNDLQKNTNIFSRCYSENLYFNFLKCRGFLFNYQIAIKDNFNIFSVDLFSFSTYRKYLHITIKNNLK